MRQAPGRRIGTMNATHLNELLEAAETIVADPWVANAGDLDEDESTDFWPADFTPHYAGDWREVGYPHTIVPGFDYCGKPDESIGLGSGSDFDWTTSAGAEFVAAVILLREADARPSGRQLEDFAKLITARAETNGEWRFDEAEVQGWLAGEAVSP